LQNFEDGDGEASDRSRGRRGSMEDVLAFHGVHLTCVVDKRDLEVTQALRLKDEN